VVLQISLLYTVFRRVDSGKTSQVPNNILNTQWIENVSRSKQMSETIKLAVDFATTFEDIQALKEEMAKFVKENNRDYFPDFDIEIAGVNNLDQLELKIKILHKVRLRLWILDLIYVNDTLCRATGQMTI